MQFGPLVHSFNNIITDKTRITDLVRNVSDEKIWNIHFVCRYTSAFINLACVQSVIQLMNTLFVTFVLL